MQAIDPEFKHPTAYTWSAGVQREMPFGFVVDATYVGRRGLYMQRERNINQLLPGTVQANPGVQRRRSPSLQGLQRDPSVGERGPLESTTACSSVPTSATRNGFKFGVAYTLGKSEDNASGLRNVLWNTYDDSNFWGRRASIASTSLSVYYIYDLPFWRERTSLMKNLLGGWQISGASFFRTGTPFSITRRQRHRGRRRRRQRTAVESRRRYYANANGKFSAGARQGRQLRLQSRGVRQPGGRHVRQLDPRTSSATPGDQQWDLALFKNFNLAGTQKLQFRVEMFNFINHPNLSGADSDITNANFGRSITKDGNRRDIQLALRYMF